MKKNLIIVALIVITFISMLYGYSQKVRAEQQTLIAQELTVRAKKQTAIAVENKELRARAEECCNRCP